MSGRYFDQAFPVHRRGKNRARQLTAPEQSLYLWILRQDAGLGHACRMRFSERSAYFRR